MVSNALTDSHLYGFKLVHETPHEHIAWENGRYEMHYVWLAAYPRTVDGIRAGDASQNVHDDLDVYFFLG